MASKKALFLTVGLMLAIVTTSFLYVQLGEGEGALGLNITASYATFTVNESGNIIVAGREQSILLDGTKTVAVNKTALFYDVTGDTLRYMRVKTYKNSPAIVSEKWTFNSTSNDITLFPVKHEIEVTNAAGLTLRYKVDKLTGAKAHVARSPERFGHQMSVEFEPGYKTAKVYSGYMQVDYPVTTASQTFNVRLFDPPCVTPIEDLIISTDTVLCPGFYQLNDATANGSLVITGQNFIVDFNRSIINGSLTSNNKGILLQNAINVTVKNADIRRFYYGVYSNNTNSSFFINSVINQTDSNCISLWGISTNDTIDNNTLINCGWNGAALNNGANFTRNRVYNTTHHAVDLWANSNGASAQISNIYVARNTWTWDASNTVGGGIYINNASSSTVEYNTLTAVPSTFGIGIGSTGNENFAYNNTIRYNTIDSGSAMINFCIAHQGNASSFVLGNKFVGNILGECRGREFNDAGWGATYSDNTFASSLGLFRSATSTVNFTFSGVTNPIKINFSNGGSMIFTHGAAKNFTVVGYVVNLTTAYPYSNVFNATNSQILATGVTNYLQAIPSAKQIVIGDLYGVPSNINNFNMTFNNTYPGAIYCVDFTTEDAS